MATTTKTKDRWAWYSNKIIIMLDASSSGGVGMAIPDGSAHCCTCTREPISITMHMENVGAEELLVRSSHHCSECHGVAKVLIC